MPRSISLTLDGRTEPELVSERVIDALARAAEVEVGDLDLCLYDYIDPSALDALFSHTGAHGTRSGTVSFRVEEARVTCTVTDDGGVVRVDPLPSERGYGQWEGIGRPLPSNAD